MKSFNNLPDDLLIYFLKIAASGNINEFKQFSLVNKQWYRVSKTKSLEQYIRILRNNEDVSGKPTNSLFFGIEVKLSEIFSEISQQPLDLQILLFKDAMNKNWLGHPSYHENKMLAMALQRIQLLHQYAFYETNDSRFPLRAAEVKRIEQGANVTWYVSRYYNFLLAKQSYRQINRFEARCPLETASKTCESLQINIQPYSKLRKSTMLILLFGIFVSAYFFILKEYKVGGKNDQNSTQFYIDLCAIVLSSLFGVFGGCFLCKKFKTKKNYGVNSKVPVITSPPPSTVIEIHDEIDAPQLNARVGESGQGPRKRPLVRSYSNNSFFTPTVIKKFVAPSGMVIEELGDDAKVVNKPSPLNA